MLQPLLKSLTKSVRFPSNDRKGITYRRYRRSDLHDILTLFYRTVHEVCAYDYTTEQLDAWAPENLDRISWARSLRKNICFVAEYQGIIVGFGDLFYKGNEVNRLYTHKDYQGWGIASNILELLEEEARKFGFDEIVLESSLTAKRFYQSQGFECKDIVKKCLNNQIFYNYFMVKSLAS